MKLQLWVNQLAAAMTLSQARVSGYGILGLKQAASENYENLSTNQNQNMCIYIHILYYCLYVNFTQMLWVPYPPKKVISWIQRGVLIGPGPSVAIVIVRERTSEDKSFKDQKQHLSEYCDIKCERYKRRAPSRSSIGRFVSVYLSGEHGSRVSNTSRH